MKKRTTILLALIGLTLVLEACNLLSHGKEDSARKQPPQNVNQTQVNTDSLPASGQTNSQTSSSNTENYIGETKALEIALNHAGVNTQDLLFSKSHLDRDDGRTQYDVEFYAGNKEYDYEIDAISGNILSFDADMEYDFIPPANQNDAQPKQAPDPQVQQTPVKQQEPVQTQAPTQQQEPVQAQPPVQQQQQPASNAETTLESAKQIALSKVPGASSDHIRIKEDYDDGRLTYEGKIIFNQMEYEFEIDAATGNITDWDAESIYD